MTRKEAFYYANLTGEEAKFFWLRVKRAKVILNPGPPPAPGDWRMNEVHKKAKYPIGTRLEALNRDSRCHETGTVTGYYSEGMPASLTFNGGLYVLFDKDEKEIQVPMDAIGGHEGSPCWCQKFALR